MLCSCTLVGGILSGLINPRPSMRTYTVADCTQNSTNVLYNTTPGYRSLNSSYYIKDVVHAFITVPCTKLVVSPWPPIAEIVSQPVKERQNSR